MVYRETLGSSLRAGHTSFVLVSPVTKYGGSLRIMYLFDLYKPSKIMLPFSSHLPSGGKIRLRTSQDVLCAWADSYISSRYILFQTGFFLRQLKSPHGLIGSNLLKILICCRTLGVWWEACSDTSRHWECRCVLTGTQLAFRSRASACSSLAFPKGKEASVGQPQEAKRHLKPPWPSEVPLGSLLRNEAHLWEATLNS